MRSWLFAVLCALTLAGSAFAHAELRIGLMPAYNSIPLIVADKAGYFASCGVNVELVPFSGQLERETALQTGAIDGTISDMINAIQARFRGFDSRVTSVSEGSFCLLSAPRSGLYSMADVRRQRGAVRTGLLENSIVFYVSERMMESAGADPKLIQLVPIVALPARLQMLLAGKIDAACLPEPLATMAEAGGAHRLADTDAMGTTPGVILFTGKALAAKSGEIEAFYRAYDMAVREVNANGEKYRADIVAACQFPPAVQDLMRLPRFRPSFTPSADLVSDVALWMKGKGLVAQVPSYQDIVMRGFAADAESR
jgi:NitT/TauT family transport system substrate-binding protein